MSTSGPSWPPSALASYDQARAMLAEHDWCSDYEEAIGWYAMYLADVVGGDLLDEVESEATRRLFVSGWEVVRLPAWNTASPERQYARLALAWNDARIDGTWDMDNQHDAELAITWMLLTVVSLWIANRTYESLGG